MQKKTSKKSLLDAYQFSGFRTSKAAKGMFGDKSALVLSLSRRSKKVDAASAADFTEGGTIEKLDLFGTSGAATDAYTLRLKLVDCYARAQD